MSEEENKCDHKFDLSPDVSRPYCGLCGADLLELEQEERKGKPMTEKPKYTIEGIREMLKGISPYPWEYLRTDSKGEITGNGWIATKDGPVLGVYNTDKDYAFTAQSPSIIEFLLSEIQRKDEALRFYANPDSYKQKLLHDSSFPQYQPRTYDVEPVIADRGDRARRALEGE